MDTPKRLKAAVLIDGSALFFAIRDLYPEHSLNYEVLVDILCRQFGAGVGGADHGPKARLLLSPENAQLAMGSPWIMWTSASNHNEGQAKFLSFIERKLSITVRRFTPRDSLMIDSQIVEAASGGARMSERLTRFDASIAYMIGRLAENHQVIVVSDSFSLAEPLVRATHARWGQSGGTPQVPNVIAYFGRALDPRWHSVLDRDQFGDPDTGALQHFDLDCHSEQLFGVRNVSERNWWTTDLPSHSGVVELRSSKKTRAHFIRQDRK